VKEDPQDPKEFNLKKKRKIPKDFRGKKREVLKNLKKG